MFKCEAAYGRYIRECINRDEEIKCLDNFSMYYNERIATIEEIDFLLDQYNFLKRNGFHDSGAKYVAIKRAHNYVLYKQKNPEKDLSHILKNKK